MKYLLAVTLLTLTAPAFADELSDGYAACQRNRAVYAPNPHLSVENHRNGTEPVWKEGWEHCDGIVLKYRATLPARQAEEEASNPELKKSRDLARKLAGQAQ